MFVAEIFSLNTSFLCSKQVLVTALQSAATHSTSHHDDRRKTKKAARVVGAGLVVVGVVVGVGFATNALVLVAMSHFGIVVPGVGTLHAVGGAAAQLQAVSHFMLQKKVALEAFAAGQKKRLPNFKNLLELLTCEVQRFECNTSFKSQPIVALHRDWRSFDQRACPSSFGRHRASRRRGFWRHRASHWQGFIRRRALRSRCQVIVTARRTFNIYRSAKGMSTIIA
jgi:hypothetical protein